MSIEKKDIEELIRLRMAQRGVGGRDIKFFLEAWRNLENSDEQLAWQDVQPAAADDVGQLPAVGSEAERRLLRVGLENMARCAIVKLNGGRSTTMGGKVPKCTLPAKDGKSFLEIVLGQVMSVNDSLGIEMPLILMNSFFTGQKSSEIVGRTPLIIMDFIQNEYPRTRVDNLHPLETGSEEDWCPGGHGDFFASLYGSGLLADLLELGFRYVFISNIDNLSAEVSPLILGNMVAGNHDFVMEVTRKTDADLKGGSPVIYRDNLTMLEIAQVPDSYLGEFQDIDRFSYFNTNNLWVDLRALDTLLVNNELRLPVIQNRKRICDTEVIQIETAMGAALQCFARPALLEVPRSRFAPVKRMEDLHFLQSEAFVLNEEFQVRRNPDWSSP
ncbi:MAG: UTP--glucose-1-phosphate uridylyltransferase [Thermodesulfobacteriota bacterium]